MILQPFGNFEAPTNAGDAPNFTVPPAASTTLTTKSICYCTRYGYVWHYGSFSI